MIAIFDLDETLIQGDCVTLWCQWLCEHNLIQNMDQFMQEEAKLMANYKAKTLNQQDCMDHIFAPVAHLTILEVQTMITEFVVKKIVPIVYQAGGKLIQEHLDNGDEVMIISASPRIFVQKVAEICFNIETVFGIEITEQNNHYSSKILGLIPYQSGKVDVFKAHLTSSNIALPEAFERSYFYSDSSNDLPLLELVAYPNVVNPDEHLKITAESNNWPILQFTKLMPVKQCQN